MTLSPIGGTGGPARAEAVATRLNYIFGYGMNTEMITPGVTSGGDYVVHQVQWNSYTSNLIATAGNEDAAHYGTTRWHTTLKWANGIRHAIDRPQMCVTNNQEGKLRLDDLKKGVEPVVATWAQTKATYYGYETAYNQTANGECWHPFDNCCAMWAMNEPDTCTFNRNYVPFGTYIRVTNLNNGRQIVTRVVDRGPRKSDRACIEKKFIDLSRGAAEAIGFDFLAGEIPVKLERLS